MGLFSVECSSAPIARPPARWRSPNSGGGWLPAIATTFYFIGDHEGASAARALGSALLLSELLGLGAGGWFGQRDGVNRAQVFLADAGAVLGGGALPLLAWLVSGEAERGPMLGACGFGMAAGFIGTYALATRLPRARAASAALAQRAGNTRLSIAPTTPGSGGTLQLSGRF